MSTKKGRFGNPANRKLSPFAELMRRAKDPGLIDPRETSGASIIGGDPHGRENAIIDPRNAVLLQETNVAEIAVGRDNAWDQRAWFLTLAGRINKTPDQVTVGFIVGTDGIAALLTELLSMADRAGPELLDDTVRRLTALHQEKNVDLHWLKAAVEMAIENQEESTPDV